MSHLVEETAGCAMSQVSQFFFFLTTVWFVAITTTCHIFVAPCPTRHVLIFLSNFVTNVVSNLLTKLNMVATIC